MTFLIATQNAFLLWNDGREIVLHSGLGAYYGITWSEQRLYVVARGCEPARVLAFDKNFWPVDPPPFGPADDTVPHQALWWDDVLYVADSHKVVFWREGGDATSWLGAAPKDEGDNHVNSIWREPDSDSFWVVDHRRTVLPKRIRVFDKEGICVRAYEINLPSLAERVSHCGIHNVYVENDTLFTLGPSSLVVAGLPTMDPCNEIPIDGVVKGKHYLRGFSRSRDYFYIGVSLAAPRDRRGWGASQIVVLDNYLQKVERIVLDPRYGQVMEIRLLDGDLAHNGITCPIV